MEYFCPKLNIFTIGDYMLYILISIIVIYFLMPGKNAKFGFIRIKDYIIPISIILLLILLVVFSKDVFDSAHNGLTLWVNNVVPSLFPFLICLELLKKTNIIKIIGKILEPIIRPIFNIPGSGVFAVVMGMCSGYPVGSKFATSLRETNQCSKAEGERLLAFTNTSGPLFILGAVGIGMFSDNKIGFLLLVTHFIAALLVGFCFRFYKKDSSTNIIIQEKPKKNNRSETIKLSTLGLFMGEAIKSSIATLLLICGFIVFFCVLGTILDEIGLTDLITNGLNKIFGIFNFPIKDSKDLSIGCFKGILEITSGLKILSNLSLDYTALLPIVATILGFGGLSVHMQVASIISNTDLSLKPYLLGKTLHGIFAGMITYFVLNYTDFFNLEAVETFSVATSNNLNNDVTILGSGNVLIMSLSFLILISLVKILFRKERIFKHHNLL